MAHRTVTDSTPGSPQRFAFGRNWQSFSRSLTPERLEIARAELAGMLGTPDLRGKSFLDAGSGSGIHGLAALRLGAEVVSFDYDADSMACTEELRAAHAPDADWRVEQGSVLDRDYLAGLGRFDVVYSWGVLHHTGRMWEALENLLPLVADDGHLFVALYNDQGGASRRWLALKRLYNRAPGLGKWALLLSVGGLIELRSALIRLIRLRNPLPFARWREHRRLRGMSFWHDHVDWIGGYPFEVARPEEVLDRCRAGGLVLERLRTMAGGHGCNEFVFRRDPRGTQASPPVRRTDASAAPARGKVDPTPGRGPEPDGPAASLSRSRPNRSGRSSFGATRATGAPQEEDR